MVTIIDRTIAELIQRRPDTKAEALDELSRLLYSAGADIIEHSAVSAKEFRINDVRETRALTLAAEVSRDSGVVRLVGFDDILMGNWRSDFRNLFDLFRGELEFCPLNSLGLATATAVEWALMFKKKCVIITSFGGIGSCASFEETVMALRSARVRKTGRTYTEFPIIAEFVESLTGLSFPVNKPIIGSEIYKVKSGIHVDGILKQPKCYTPFDPADVGRKTEFVLSKLSGMGAVRNKLKLLKIDADSSEAEKMLQLVKKRSILKNGNISDDEFLDIASEVKHISSGSL